MTSLFRNSRIVLIGASCIRRSAATTSTSSGGTAVRPSGASQNLSEASRAADGTDMAMRDAKQRGTSSDSSKSKSTGEQSQRYVDFAYRSYQRCPCRRCRAAFAAGF